MSKLVGIETKSQKPYLCFRGSPILLSYCDVIRLNRYWDIQDGSLKNWHFQFVGHRI